jgi:betaine-aldehyde dehydrogenase
MNFGQSPLRSLQTQLYIDGVFRPARGGETLDVLNPSTAKVITKVAAAGVKDVDDAVQAAHRQFNGGEWSRFSGAQRGRLLYRLSELIERDLHLIAAMESLDNGKVLGLSVNVDLPNVVDTFRYFAGWADKLEGRTIPTAGAFGRPTLSYTIREPLGVIGAIAAYNAPTMYVGWKAAAALAAGNTVVLKPAEEAPLTSLYIATLFTEAGFPGGSLMSSLASVPPLVWLWPDILWSPSSATLGAAPSGAFLPKKRPSS